MPKARTAEVDLQKLCDATRASRKVLEVFRRVRMETVRRYAGDNWSTETSHKKRPVNFLSLYLSTIPRRLISHDPRFSLKTFDRSYRSVVAVEEDWGNRQVAKMGLAEVMHRAVLDALIGPMGITKVALATPGEAEKSGWGLEFGQPFCSVIDLDDWAHDPHARDIREASWYAHRCRYPLDSLKDSKLYAAAKRKKVTANPDKQFNRAGDERISMLQRQYVSNDQTEPYEYVDLWEYYLPRERMILWMLSDDGAEPSASEFEPGKEAAFLQRDWVGPDEGPYQFLRYLLVPGQSLGKGPVQDLVNLDEHLNGLEQKLIEQAARQKEVFGVHAAADADAQRYRDARDGEMIRFDNPDKIKPIAGAGANPNNQAFAMQLWDILNKLAGNLELMAGLAPQAKTATQDKMLNANSSASITDMQQITVGHTAKVIKNLCWFWHYHPTKAMTAYKEIQGLSVPIKQTANPAQRRQVPYDQIDIQVHPYSFQYQSPQEMMGFLDQTVMQIISPLMPLMQQQGVFFDLPKYLELKAKYGNSPDLIEICHIGEPVGETEGDGRNERPGKPAVSERTYNRVNSSEATSQGQNKSMQAALLGMNAGGNNGTMKQ